MSEDSPLRSIQESRRLAPSRPTLAGRAWNPAPALWKSLPDRSVLSFLKMKHRRQHHKHGPRSQENVTEIIRNPGDFFPFCFKANVINHIAAYPSVKGIAPRSGCH